jgi:hypothetical protein
MKNNETIMTQTQLIRRFSQPPYFQYCQQATKIKNYFKKSWIIEGEIFDMMNFLVKFNSLFPKS